MNLPPARPSRTSPWTRGDAISAGALVGIGCLVWAIGWYRVAEEPAFNAQVAPLNLAIVGIVIVGVGQIRWFLGGRRAVHRRRLHLLGVDAPSRRPTVPAVDTAEAFIGAERFYHRSDCVMVVDREWSSTSRDTHEQAGRTPCGVCGP